jgi:hypothetical protein
LTAPRMVPRPAVARPTIHRSAPSWGERIMLFSGA